MAMKFKQFVEFKNGIKEESRRKVKEEKFNKFITETLKKYKSKCIEDLNDEDYDKFLDEVKSYRKRNLTKL